uniref:Uncharacterized protein n=1 Tax=Trichogramma kaykai TaxID=54128 RepID=A0ABD2WPY8_9HYME
MMMMISPPHHRVHYFALHGRCIDRAELLFFIIRTYIYVSYPYTYTYIPSSIAAETRWYEIIEYQSYFHNIPVSSRRIMYELATRRSTALMDIRAHILHVMTECYTVE